MPSSLLSMSNKDYGWKRFWCPRSGSIHLADGGYLDDPDTEWGKAHNPELVSLEAIADVPCLVLLGEPGIGKSRELENLKIFTEKKICASSQVLELNLRSCTHLKEDLFKDETFTDWLKGSYHLYLFLDSLDEGLLSVPMLATGLIDELRRPKYQNHIDRLHIRLACRTFVFPAILEEGLKELWEKSNFAIYELAPLRRVDVIEAAKVEGLSSDDLLKEINQKDVVPLAIKPITLKFLLNTYHSYHGQFPADQKLHELYLEGCKLLCEEVSKSRQASNRVGNLDIAQRLIIAARIAAITIFTNQFAVWTGIVQGDVPDGDVLLQRLCFSYEKANGREFEITKEAVKEVLDTGLFSSRGLHRMGWAHQTYAEFLAAWYLTQHKIPLAQIKKLIFSSEDPDHKLIPQLHETAAWLASMRLEDVLQTIIKTDPDVLLQSDVPTDAGVRAAIVENLLTQYEEGKLFDRDRKNYRYYEKLKHPGLVEQLRPYICNPSKQDDARNLAIDIARACEVSELQDELTELARDSTQSIYLRANAAKAICAVGDKATRLKLKRLVTKQLPEDKDDRLKGYVFQALWPEYLTAEELFQNLTPPKRRMFFGSYQMFLDYKMLPQLQPRDLVVALNWLASQGVRRFGHPFEQLGDAILFKAWENLDLPGIAEGFIKLALMQWKKHQKIITNDGKLEQEFIASLLHNSQKRHRLVEKTVLIISKVEENSHLLLNSLDKSILIREDILWMLSHIRECDSEQEQKIWANLIRRLFRHPESMPEEAKAILEDSQINWILCDEFSYWTKTIDLNSARAVKVYTNYWQDQAWQSYTRQHNSLLEPPPKKRVLQCLDELELGDLSAWWRLNMEMTLKPESQYYGDEFELDLTQLPGWQEVDEITQRRIIEGAKKYIQQQNNISHEWIGTNAFDRPALAGCRAFLLLLQESPYFLGSLSPEIWEVWAPVIIAVPSSNQHKDCYLELVKCAYLNASQEFIKTLETLIDKENQEHIYLFVIDRLKKCWDDQLKLALLDKAKDPVLKPKCVGQLLEELLKQEFSEAGKFAKDLIYFPLPSAEAEREKALLAARILVENSNPSDWAFIWTFIQQDSSFGREILESVAYRFSHGIQLNLTEVQLADLYIWLVHHYPYDEDPDHSNEVMAYSVTARDGIASLRDSALLQLRERGTPEACAEIQRLIQELPDISWLGKTLIEAKANMRRQTWQPLKPEEFLQLVISQEPSNSDLSKQIGEIDKRTKKMEDEPKIENKITVSNSPNSPINAPVGTSGVTNSNVTLASSDTKKGINWRNWLAVIGILAGMMVSGAFNEEFRQWFNRIFSPQVQQDSTQQTD
ncbi:NACHT domain-containing protein [Egbenema bharatensis]|uniref:NACHT domain-containing protein n=1 Tax=Egbenema bharatensis TaxID=3463334 RepID=UPI003A873E33